MTVRYLVRVTLADVPGEDRELWSQQVGDVLSEAVAERGFDHVGAANVGPDAIIRFHGVSADVTGSELLGWVAAALAEGDRRYRQKRAEREQRDASLPALRDRLKAAIQAAQVGDVVIGVVSQLRDDGSVWLGVQLQRDREDPMLGHILDGVAQSARSGRTDVEYYDTTLWFVSEYDPAEVAVAIQEVDARYRAEALVRQEGLVAIEEHRRALEADLRNT
jgi:hypothetical protein